MCIVCLEWERGKGNASTSPNDRFVLEVLFREVLHQPGEKRRSRMAFFFFPQSVLQQHCNDVVCPSLSVLESRIPGK